MNNPGHATIRTTRGTTCHGPASGVARPRVAPAPRRSTREGGARDRGAGDAAPGAHGGHGAATPGGPRLFLDLDGVLADFDRGVEAVTGRRPGALRVPEMWRALSRVPAFFETLHWMEDAERLWRFCAPHAPTILTGLPLGVWAPEQKRRWVARMLGAHVPVITCMSRDKPRHAGPGDVLVDDRADARAGWEAAGGTFVHHRHAEGTIAALRALGYADADAGAPGSADALGPADAEVKDS